MNFFSICAVECSIEYCPSLPSLKKFYQWKNQATKQPCTSARRIPWKSRTSHIPSNPTSQFTPCFLVNNIRNNFWITPCLGNHALHSNPKIILGNKDCQDPTMETCFLMSILWNHNIHTLHNHHNNHISHNSNKHFHASIYSKDCITTTTTNSTTSTIIGVTQLTSKTNSITCPCNP